MIGHSRIVRAIQFSSDGRLLISASDGGYTRIWDMKTRRTRITLDTSLNSTQTASLSQDGKLALTTGNEANVRIWSTESGKLLSLLKGHQGTIQSAAFSPDGKYLAVASGDSVYLFSSAQPASEQL